MDSGQRIKGCLGLDLGLDELGRAGRWVWLDG